METITEKTFYSQLSGSAAGAVTATLIGTAIVGGSAFFCGSQLGWTNLLSVMLLILTILCVMLLLWFIIKAARVKKHPVFQRYGNAAILALKINNGMRSPRYFAKSLMGNAPFATLLTDEFIVSGAELVSYMELKDLRSVKTGAFGRYHRITVGDPLLTATSVAANKIGDRYLESKGVNSQTKFDMLIMKDDQGKEHTYSVQHKDMENVLNTLRQIAPHIRFEQ
ncbi:MAG: hypothetical protein IJK31_04435 [Ruminococcus sp.]|nr:hypothetical protein [Ruminococcus sp.]